MTGTKTFHLDIQRYLSDLLKKPKYNFHWNNNA